MTYTHSIISVLKGKRNPVWLAMLCLLLLSGCTTPPKPTWLSKNLFHLRTLDHRLSKDCRECDKEENCEQCTRCLPHEPDLISDKFNHYNSFLDGINVHHTAEHCAYETLNAYRKTTNECLAEEFEDGFVQAYLDIADGYSGETPAVPSSKYWHAIYRTPEGNARVQHWFEGYRYGALNANQDGLGQTRISTSVNTAEDYGSHQQVQQPAYTQGHHQQTQWNTSGQY